MKQRTDLNTHILGTLYLVVNDLRFEKLNKEDKNILKWASLLHDIMKKINGVDTDGVFTNGKDLVHPYNCAFETLKLG